MKKIVCLLMIALPFAGIGQSGVFDKVKQKVKDRADRHVDEGINKGLDKTEEKIKIGGSAKQGEEQKEDKPENVRPKSSPSSFESYSHYDFVPGDNIVYAEDFSQDVAGEFPLKWTSNSRGETVTIKGVAGKWLRLYQNGLFLSPYIKNLPENFTAEFDLVLNVIDKDLSYVVPELDVFLLNDAAGDENGRNFFNSQSGLSAMKIAIAPGEEDNATVYLRSEKGGNETFSNSPKSLGKHGAFHGQTVHFAIWIQKQRFRMWMNGEKIYDVPQAVPEKASFNRLGYSVASSNYDEEKVGYCITNIKFAQGAPDMRNKLITEGKLVTNGILFDVNSDVIKAESFGVLQEIAKVLKEAPEVKVSVVGYTDSDGDDVKNLDLSKRRAASVKRVLSSQFDIGENRMLTDGKGEGNPVADNSSNEGKAKNRRVEFIKL